MREQMVNRLIVLDKSKNKRLVGVISLGDIILQDKATIVAETVKGMKRRAA